MPRSVGETGHHGADGGTGDASHQISQRSP
jgi:hypothetical protein